jgi:hypothetical protein
MSDGARETELKAKAGRIDAQGISHPDVSDHGVNSLKFNGLIS